MEIILQRSHYSNLISGNQKIKEYKLLKLATYCLVQSCDDGYLIYNMLTKQMILLSFEEYREIFENVGLFSEKVEWYVKNWYFTPYDFDDNKECTSFKNIFKHLVGKQEKYEEITIYTTLKCNARCYYCFEQGNKKISMTCETAKDVVDFIIKNTNPDAYVKIIWFGGEPLYNCEVIDIISSGVRDKGRKLVSTMVSNGYLFDDSVIKRAVNLWALNDVQITLDGTENIYNASKNYIYGNHPSPFIVVWKNIKKLLDNGIYVTIRLNISENNYNDLSLLVDMLYKDFRNYSNFSVYSTQLYSHNHPFLYNVIEPEYEKSFTNYLRLQKKIEKLGIGSHKPIYKGYILVGCGADRDSSIQIDPAGNLTLCEHFVDESRVGNIYSKELNKNIINDWKTHLDKIDLCDSCPCFIECVRPKNCPQRASRQCNEYKRYDLIQHHKARMLSSYYIYKKARK